MPVASKGDIPPQPLNLNEVKSRIGYPQLAVDAEIEGKVVVRILVDKSGRVIEKRTVRDPHPILTNAVLEGVDSLVFSKAFINGEETRVWVTIPFSFVLKSDDVVAVPEMSGNGNSLYFIEDVTFEINEGNFMMVSDIYLDGQGLEEFPTEVLQYKNLEVLDLSRNSIREIPDEIGTLKKLKVLRLAGNPLTTLPKSILQLPNLKVVWLQGLQLSGREQKSLEQALGDRLYPRKANGKVLW